MFKLIALFALVAVAAAEPEADAQWVIPHLNPHLKTPSGDTVSVAAAKVHHHNLKSHEYAKKGYTFPSVYQVPHVYPTTYSGYPHYYNAAVHATYPYTYNAGVYSAYPHAYRYNHVVKRDAEADSQVVYNSAYHGAYPYNAYTGYTGFHYNPYTYGNFYNRGYYMY